MTAIIHTGMGMPSTKLCPIQGSPAGMSADPARFGNVAPCESSSAVPRAIYSVPSVAMNGATPSRVTIAPFIRPTTQLTSRRRR